MTPNPAFIRYGIKRDLPEMVAIEAYSYIEPWGEQDFIMALRQPSCICHVAELDEQLVGYLLYQTKTGTKHSSREIVRMAIHQDYRLQGIGRHMLAKKLFNRAPSFPETVKMLISERDVGAQCFLRQCGMKAGKIERQAFLRTDGCRDDGYWFTRKTDKESEVPTAKHKEIHR